MRDDIEVTYDLLVNDKILDKLIFRTTEEISGSDCLIGQERAEKSMCFGINMKEKGYNIYIAGKNGMGKTYYAKKTLAEIAGNYPIPKDWCCVYNFQNAYEPCILSLPAGIAKIFKQDMEYIIYEIIDRIPSAFNSEEYDRQKSEIMEDYHDKKNELIDDLNTSAEIHSLQVKATNNGFAFVPIIEGKHLSETEYDGLDKDDKEIILKNIAEVRLKAIDILRKVKTAEKEAEDKVKSLDFRIGCCVVENLALDFKNKYNDNLKVLKYIDCVKEDILKNLSLFVNGIDRISPSKEEDEFLSRYRVNILIDNSDTKGAPVIYDANPTYVNLVGNVEYESKQGNITTDFLMIRAGSILKANGGFLILNIRDVLRNFKAWEGLKRILNSNELRIEGIRSQLDLLTITTIKPEIIPVDVKVVLIGTEHLYELLFEYDDEFPDLFKIKVDFEADIEKSDGNVNKIVQFISNFCRKMNIRHLESDAVSLIIEHCSREAGNVKRLSACLENIIDVLQESNVWAELSGSKYISRENIKTALIEKKRRANLIEERMLRNYENKKIIIDVSGDKIGQVNGLSVIEIGGHSFGKPCRITASTYMGRSGIINIEREVQMSGNIHSKSVMIISGYLGKKYARNIPLSLTAHICFEQLYGFIDGDSASIAELYTILSSLSGIPIKQSIAVTGSLNQMGEVQPVGGINEKIEGFFKVCSISGLNRNQGVIIPYQNVDDIVLEDDVLKAVRDGEFHIYAIKDVEEGIEILTGLRAGAVDEKGEFEKDTFNYYVYQRLRELIKNYNALEDLKHDSDMKQ